MAYILAMVLIAGICLKPLIFSPAAQVYAASDSVTASLPQVSVADTGGYPVNASYNIILENRDTSETESIQVANNGTGSFAARTYTVPSIYNYKVYEEITGTTVYTEDTTVYYLYVYVTWDSAQNLVAQCFLENETTMKKQEGISFSNKYPGIHVTFETDGNGVGDYKNAQVEEGSWNLIYGTGFAIKIEPNPGYVVQHVYVTDSHGNKNDYAAYLLPDGTLDLSKLTEDVAIVVQFVPGTSSGSTSSGTTSSGTASGTTSSGTTSGTTSGTASGTTSGTASGTASGTTSGTVSGTTSGTASGKTPAGGTTASIAPYAAYTGTSAAAASTVTASSGTSSSGAASPAKTGDSSNAGLWMILVVLSGITAAVAAGYAVSRKNEEDR